MGKHDDEEKQTHPAFAMVGFSRRQGNPGRLFGSALEHHESYVCLSIRRAERIRESGYDRFFGGIRGDLIEVDLSAAQFAELLTTMNVGMGVPCTLRSFDAKKVEPIPDDDTLEVEHVRQSFAKKMRGLADKCKDDVKEVKELLAKKNLTQADRAAILSKMESVMQEVSSNTPYMLQLFEEASEKVVSHAKAEVDAFITTNVVAEGLRAIKERVEAAPKALPAAKKEGDDEA